MPGYTRFAPLFEQALAARGHTRSTRESYLGALRRFGCFVGDVCLEEACEESPVLALQISVVLPPQLALLVSAVRGASALDPRRTAATATAVPVTAVARSADRERRPASLACQQVQDDADQEPLAQTPSRRVDKPARRCNAPRVAPTPACRTRPGRAATRRGFPSRASPYPNPHRHADAAPPRMMTNIPRESRLPVRRTRFLTAVHSCAASLTGVTQNPGRRPRRPGFRFSACRQRAYSLTPDAPSARMMNRPSLASRKTALPGERLQSGTSGSVTGELRGPRAAPPSFVWS